MFIPKSFPFITRIDDTDSGGGSEQEESFDNFGVPEVQEVEEVQQEQQENTEVKENPYWKEIFEVLPQEFHNQIKPKLKGWDDNFAKVQSDYAPYKPLLENKIPYEDVDRAIQLAMLVNTNPQAVYEELGKRFGFGQGQKQVEEEEQEEEQQEETTAPLDLSKNPQFQQMQQFMEQSQRTAEAQWKAQQEQQITDQIESEFTALETKLQTKLTPKVKAEILRRTVNIGDNNGGKYDVNAGYQDYASWVNEIRNSTANRTAPKVFPGNGGLPIQGKQFGELDDEGRVARIAGMLEALNNQNNQ